MDLHLKLVDCSVNVPTEIAVRKEVEQLCKYLGNSFLDPCMLPVLLSRLLLFGWPLKIHAYKVLASLYL